MKQAINNREILLDTCVIHNLIGKNDSVRTKSDSFINSLIKNSNNTLYISEFSHYEILRNVSGIKHKEAQKTLKSFQPVPPTSERLHRATRLYNSYHNHKEVKQFLNSISNIDVFLGSLVFTKHKPLLLTANHCDFPRPFFTEIYSHRIEYRKPRHNKTSIYYYFLEANLDELII